MDGSELIDLADKLDRLHSDFEQDHATVLQRASGVAGNFGEAWSGSNLGYHSRVYYAGFQRPPPEAHFRQELGLDDGFGGGSTGDWEEYRYQDVVDAIHRAIGNLDQVREGSARIAREVRDAQANLVSGLTVALVEHDDTYLPNQREKAEKVRIFSAHDIVRVALPKGRFISRALRAISEGAAAAPHQVVLGELIALGEPSVRGKELAELARQAGSHLVRLARRGRKERLVGTNVFIGHGRSPAWRMLKDFIKDRLGLPHDEFNRVPVAGITNIARLSEMLDAAAIAFLILTAEDEQVDGKMQARMNVIHEVGLFQGRLGFTKAIVLLEEGREEFSNIQGLGQIRFPKDNIAAAFEEIRWVLEREEVIAT